MSASKYLTVFAALVLVSAVEISAHHTLHEYEKSLKAIDGTLVELSLRNPHSSLVVEIRGDRSSTERWTVEWVSALVLKQQGVAGDTLRPGDHLVITGNPARHQGVRRMWLRTIERPEDRWRWAGEFN